jgi:hypothetical protein
MRRALIGSPRECRQLRAGDGAAEFCRRAEISAISTARAVSNWLRGFTQETLQPLMRLNQELVLDTLAGLDIPRLTRDVDGTVVRTGATVARAFRGFIRTIGKGRSYCSLLAHHLGQTGHILRVKERPGNVHDSKQSAAFLRELIDGVRTRVDQRLLARVPHGCRVFPANGAAPARRARLRLSHQGRLLSCLPLRQLAAERRHWHALAPRREGLRALARLPCMQAALLSSLRGGGSRPCGGTGVEKVFPLVGALIDGLDSASGWLRAATASVGLYDVSLESRR